MQVQTYYSWLGILVVALMCVGVAIFSPGWRIETKGVQLAAPPALAQLPSSFDRPVPQPLTVVPEAKGFDLSLYVRFNSFDERIAYLRTLAPKPIVYPDGFAEFIHAEDSKANWNKGNVLFLTERDGMPGGATVQDYLTTALSTMTLKWTYDSDRDVILTDFQWRHDDSRTSRELAYFLTQNRPPRYHWLMTNVARTRPGFSGEVERGPEPWLDAFDALLSKPGNSPYAWKLRFADDVRRYCTPSVVDNLMAQRMKDDKGAEHIVFVNDEPELIYPGEGFIAYYVFDPNGKFEKGGILRSGHRCGSTSAWLNKEGKEMTLRNYFNGAGNPVDTNFMLTDEGLVPHNESGWSKELGIGGTIYLTNSPGT